MTTEVITQSRITSRGNLSNIGTAGGHLIVGDNKEEADTLELPFFLGPICRRDHKAYSWETKSPVPYSLRHRKGGRCVLCKHLTDGVARDKRYRGISSTPKVADMALAKARHSIEDIRTAKELGITVEEYLS